MPISTPEFEQSQFGVNIGGPIIKDKTFFFASYDGWRYRDMARDPAHRPRRTTTG